MISQQSLVCYLLGVPAFALADGLPNGQGVAKKFSEELVDTEFLDTYIVVLFEGENPAKEKIYSFVELNGRSLAAVFACLRKGETFTLSEFGTVLYSGTNTPPRWLRDQMRIIYNMIQVPDK